MTGSGSFVGRVHELSTLRLALQGGARLLLVTGDAGVGKTRFVAQGLRLAVDERPLSAWGACLPLAEKLPLLPVAGVLDALSRHEDGALLENAFGRAPAYVRVEAARLLPGLTPADPGSRARPAEWKRDRLFSGLAELLAEVAGQAGLAVVIEDVHWADSTTLDFLTFLAGAGRGAAVTVVVTCRGNEVPAEPVLARWLAHVRGSRQAEEIWLGPLSRAEVADQVAGLMGASPDGFADEVFARGEGNPFFTEQLVAALADPAGGEPGRAAGLPARLAELLMARTAGCGGEAGAVLAALAVAGRLLTEGQLCHVTELGTTGCRAALRELAAARLLAEGTTGGYRARHALLAEAVAAGLLPGERLALHERVAEAMQATGEQALAAEAAAHWAAAGRGAAELRARITAAEAAERVFGYAEAAVHWRRAIELSRTVPGPGDTPGPGHMPRPGDMPGTDLPRWYLRAIDALLVSGDSQQAAVLADEAYSRFAGHPDPAVAAVIHERAGRLRALGVTLLGQPNPSDAGLGLVKEALRLFEQAPPSVDQAEAWYYYVLLFGEAHPDDFLSALHRALQIGEAVGATALMSRTLSLLPLHSFDEGHIGEGFGLLRRAGALAQRSGDADAALSVAVFDSDALLRTARIQDAADTALRGLEAARQAGLQAYYKADILAANAAEALVYLGRTAEAGTLIDPLTSGEPDREHRYAHQARAEIDLLRGDLPAAHQRQRKLEALGPIGLIDSARHEAQQMADLALWAGRPDDGLAQAQRGLVLASKAAAYQAKFCGHLLTSGMRACADLAEQARAGRGEPAAALAVAAELAAWADLTGGAPFTDHPWVATIPAERATWHAERTRLAGASDPGAWHAAAQAWQDLGFPHAAGYACWREAEALLYAGQHQAAVTPLRAAAGAAAGHAPLLSHIRTLAQRARIAVPAEPPTHAGPAVPAAAAPGAGAAGLHGLTSRELAVLRLLAAGRTNGQIGAELFISPKTASVHVTSILRKLGVTGRVQAAAVAERAGLLDDGPACSTTGLPDEGLLDDGPA